MSVGCCLAHFEYIFQGVQRPARAMFVSVCAHVCKLVHIRPAFVPVRPQGDERSFRDRPVFCFIGFDIFYRYGIVYVIFYFFTDINDCQRECEFIYSVLFRQRRIFYKMPGKIYMGAELAGEFKGMDQAFQHGIAPVKHHLAQFHGTFRYAAPERAVVVEGMGKLHPFVPLGLKRLQCIPQFVFHYVPSLKCIMFPSKNVILCDSANQPVPKRKDPPRGRP